MHDLISYFTSGIQHITDLRSLDHLLLVAAFCIRYLFTDWKKVVILITAFTIGNAVTMILIVFNIVRVSSHWIEFLIPVSIIFTAITNVFVKKFVYRQKYPPIYFLALAFGLIHGCSFNNYLRSFLGRGNKFLQFTGFNLGLEAGQLFIVISILLLTFLCVNVFKVNRREYILFLSGGVLAVALQMALQRMPF